MKGREGLIRTSGGEESARQRAEGAKARGGSRRGGSWLGMFE